MEHVNCDLEREGRCGFPEVVFGAGKTPSELIAAVRGLLARSNRALATRVDAEALIQLREAFPNGEAVPRGGCFLVNPPPAEFGPVAVVSAGTSDAPVVEEALATLRMRAVSSRCFPDCGVAGLHRVLARLDEIRSCLVAIVVAGMDGVLPSVLGGLVDIPVIGVPTSIGYGVAAGGHSALCTMLSSCAPGVTVVNVDNGFGAGYAAATIVRLVARHTRPAV